MALRAMFRWSNTLESMMQASEYPPGSLNKIVVSLLHTCFYVPNRAARQTVGSLLKVGVPPSLHRMTDEYSIYALRKHYKTKL
eukprot:scaffold18718_cov45-Attheya_sp.AAC.6